MRSYGKPAWRFDIMTSLDTIVRGGTVVTAADIMRADIGIADGKIAALAETLTGAANEIDATGLLVLPGGVDSHVHVEQRGNASNTAVDSFFSTTVSAACGGTTTFISFARQNKGEPVQVTIDEYKEKACRSVIDYAFHMTVTDATRSVLEEELPRLIGEGHRSIKFFMNTPRSHLTDEEILGVLSVARSEGALVVVHAENYAATNWLTDRLTSAGLTHPKYLPYAKPVPVEREAVHRIISFAELLDVPIQIFHVTSAEVVDEITRARARGVKIFAETCPQYLTITADDLDRPQEEAAKWVFGPPPRSKADQDALWRALRSGVISVVSSDHVPHAAGGPTGKIAATAAKGGLATQHGIPGIETRMPLLFSEGVKKGRIDLNTFVALTSTNPAKIFGLYPRKGSITIGGDADLAIWDPDRRVKITNDALHHSIDYTPYENFEIVGWPVTTLSRGEIIWKDDRIRAAEGRGRWLHRERYDVINPSGRFVTPFNPHTGEHA